MQTVTVQINDKSALKALHALADKQVISIVDEDDFDTPSLAGTPMSILNLKIGLALQNNHQQYRWLKLESNGKTKESSCNNLPGKHHFQRHT